MNNGNDDLFLLKMDPTGNVLWLKGFGGTFQDLGRSITVDQNNSITFTGYYFSDSLTFGSSTISKAGNSDIFVARFDSAGNALKALNIGTIGGESASSLTSDEGGNIYLAGTFTSLSIVIGNFTLMNSGVYETFVCKLDTSLNAIWAKSEGGNCANFTNSIDYRFGKLCLTGQFVNGSFSFGPYILSNNGQYDLFICEMDSSGNELYAINTNDTSVDAGTSVAYDQSGNLIAGGIFMDRVTMGANTFISAGNYDFFLSRINFTSSVNDHSNSFPHQIYIFPNPVKCGSYIKLSESCSNVNAVLYDVMGNMISNNLNFISGNYHYMDQAPGIYFMRLTYSDKSDVIRIVVE